jgi:ubiquinone/menaquinone biosynthesis C-methylase UbiE
MTRPVHRGSGRLDPAAQPGSLVDYLDRVATSPAGTDYTRRTLDALGLAPGRRLLDVGCGGGHALVAAAELVGPAGMVVGIDASVTMAAAAQARAAGRAHVAVVVADAQRLPFAADAFDGCRAERVLQHVPDPAAALAEMTRVTRAGGLVVVGDTDWGGWLLDAPNDQVTHAVLQAAARRSRNPWIGRQLVGLFQQAGLDDLQVEVVTFPGTDFDWAASVHGLAAAVEQAVGSGTLTSRQAHVWLEDRRRAAGQGRFFSALPLVTVIGRKPAWAAGGQPHQHLDSQ